MSGAAPARWCPRCEWVGGERPECPRCGTATLRIEPARRRPVPGPERREPGAPAPPAGPEGEPARSGGRRRLAAPAAAIAVVLIAVTVHVASGQGRRAAPRPARTAAPVAARRPPAGLPARLAFIDGSTDGGPGPRLYLADGAGRSPSTVQGNWLTSSFAWSPDGFQVAAIDIRGNLRVLPGGQELRRPVESVAFSPDGGHVAACAGTWPPRLVVMRAGPDRTGRSSKPLTVPGCDPVWSPDGAFVAYRLPARPSGSYRADRVGLLDVSTGRRLSLSLDWPVAWLPTTSRPPVLSGLTPRGVVLVAAGRRPTPRGVVVSAAALLQLLPRSGTARPGMLSWAPDGRWLAVAFAPGPGGDGTVVVVRPPDGRGFALSEALGSGSGPTTVDMMSWSARDQLLAEFVASGSPGRTEVLTPPAGEPETLPVRDASWSPDGRWVLGSAARGWLAVPAGAPGRTFPMTFSDQWVSAAWCCPPVAPVRPSGGTRPLELRP